ncbi:DUF5302 domain-containing protein [Georgenia alba]|uniref:DUF5302 domain-containing protein n=1 Tax=Georgenia alba TaxID=2233858 RepID=A0ABW2Q8F9_9MICO
MTGRKKAQKKDPKAGSASDEVKAKFREALEKKQARARGPELNPEDGRGVGVTPHGPVGVKREFRRKSG